MAKQKDTNAEYHSNNAISRSSLFQMSRSPAHFKYAMENKETETDALRFGTMFHAFVLEPELFEKNYILVDKIDRRILKTMIVNFQGGPVGLETLAAAIGEDSGTLEDVYDPYLLQNGFLNRTPRGRTATALAYSHLGYEMPEK